MSSLAQQAALALRTPWQWAHNHSRWTLPVLGVSALLLLAASLAAVWWVPQPHGSIIASLPVCIVLLGWWGMHFAALLRLDHPHSARFVLGHGRALRATALAAWAVGVLLCCVAALLLAWPWRGAGALSWPLVAVAAGAALLWMAMALRWWLMWFVIWLPLPLGNQFKDVGVLGPVFRALRDHWRAQPELWALLALTGMAVALCSLFGRADAAHARAYAGRERMRRIAAAGSVGQKPTLAAYGRWGEVLGSPFQHLADAWLARLLRRAGPHDSSVMARADVVLHGHHHWVRQLAGVVLMLLVVVPGLVLVMRQMSFEVSRIQPQAFIGLSIGLASIAISPIITFHGALWMSRREQALLMLLPGMPQGAALNRALARQVLLNYLRTWLVALPLFVAVAWWGQTPQVLGLLGAALPMAALLCRDLAHLRAPQAMVTLLPNLLCVGLGLLSMVGLRSQPEMLLPWALGVLGLTAALLTWRWRRLAHWPQALPAGRLG